MANPAQGIAGGVRTFHKLLASRKPVRHPLLNFLLDDIESGSPAHNEDAGAVLPSAILSVETAMRIAIIYNKPKTSTAQEHRIFRSKSEGPAVADPFLDASEYDIVGQAQLKSHGHAVKLAGFLNPP